MLNLSDTHILFIVREKIELLHADYSNFQKLNNKANSGNFLVTDLDRFLPRNSAVRLLLSGEQGNDATENYDVVTYYAYKGNSDIY